MLKLGKKVILMAIPTVEQEATSVIYRWPAQGKWTYEDYARLPDDGRRYEVIGGDLYVSPAPSPEHQQADAELMYALMAFFKQNDLGRVYSAPIDLLLPDLASPVQPDIIVILKEQLGIVKRRRIEGVPALIIEILSPGSIAYDRRTKYDLYAEAGVKEYWIVDPIHCTADVFVLRGNVYVPFGHFGRDGMIQSELLPDLRILLADICSA
jgi:Uma2 family endonuclease